MAKGQGGKTARWQLDCRLSIVDCRLKLTIINHQSTIINPPCRLAVLPSPLPKGAGGCPIQKLSIGN